MGFARAKTAALAPMDAVAKIGTLFPEEIVPRIRNQIRLCNVVNPTQVPCVLNCLKVNDQYTTQIRNLDFFFCVEILTPTSIFNILSLSMVQFQRKVLCV